MWAYRKKPDVMIIKLGLNSIKAPAFLEKKWAYGTYSAVRQPLAEKLRSVELGYQKK